MNNKRIFPQSHYRIAVGVFLISGSLLALEVFYVRIVSILLYPVATYLVISLALLGLGASGGFLSLRGNREYTLRLASIGAFGFSLTILLSLLPIWFAHSSLILSISLPILLAVPMFFGGIAISVALSLPNTRVPILYFADLIGAGISAGLVLLGLNYLGGIQIAFLISLVGLLASATFSSKRTWIWLTSLSIILILLLGLSYRFPKGIIPISPKELKLMLALDANEVQWEYQGWSPLARVDVLSIKGDTLDPNLNISYKLVTHDGGAPSLLLHLPDESKKDAFINRTIFGVPYWINQGPSVLVIGLGGGPDIIAALAADANQIIGAEVNPEMVEIVENHFADFVGDPYSDPSVQIELADGRHLLAKSDQKFDIIQLTGVDTTIATLGANPNLAENYLYTREAFIEYLDHLTETGMLSVSFPNVEGLGLRLLVLATESLREHRVTLIEDHVVMSEMTGYVHVLVKKKSFTTDEIDVLQEHFNSNPTSIYFPLYNRIFGTPTQDFISERRILLAPGLPRSNQYTSYIEALKDGTEHEFLAGQPQTVLPPTDDWPFFFVLDKWGFQSINYDILMLTLFFLLSFLVLLILLPPFLLNRKGFKISSPGLLAVYFGCLGLGFIFVEVIMIQKLSLIVGHPSYSLAITLCALLIASGLGSLISELIPISDKWKAPITASAIAILVLIAYLVLDRFGGVILIQPFGMRVFLSAAIVAVPGLFMGVPFPAGLSIVKEVKPNYLPWAWGLNATFTVIGTILALLLALSRGYSSVLMLAAFLYFVAFLSILAFNKGLARA